MSKSVTIDCTKTTPDSLTSPRTEELTLSNATIFVFDKALKEVQARSTGNSPLTLSVNFTDKRQILALLTYLQKDQLQINNSRVSLNIDLGEHHQMSPAIGSALQESASPLFKKAEIWTDDEEITGDAEMSTEPEAPENLTSAVTALYTEMKRANDLKEAKLMLQLKAMQAELAEQEALQKQQEADDQRFEKEIRPSMYM